MLEIKNLKKSFSKHKVLKNINCTINDKEIVTLLGANGSGKTTLINCILKLYSYDCGEIIFNGINIYNIKNNIYYSKIAVVLESSDNIYDYISGLDNIKYFIGLSGVFLDDIKDDLEYMLNLFDLKDHIEKKVGYYSRGMKQKLAIVIALLLKPNLLILDEPTIGLDLKTKYQLLDILNKIVSERNISILLTTHQVEILNKLNSKILFLVNGEIKSYNNINELVPNQNSFEVKYLDNKGVLHTRFEEDKDFNNVCKKYCDCEIVSINKNSYDIEKLILEKLE